MEDTCAECGKHFISTITATKYKNWWKKNKQKETYAKT